MGQEEAKRRSTLPEQNDLKRPCRCFVGDGPSARQPCSFPATRPSVFELIGSPFSTGSYPPGLSGWHRTIRHIPFSVPTTGPFL